MKIVLKLIRYSMLIPYLAEALSVYDCFSIVYNEWECFNKLKHNAQPTGFRLK